MAPWGQCKRLRGVRTMVPVERVVRVVKCPACEGDPGRVLGCVQCCGVGTVRESSRDAACRHEWALGESSSKERRSGLEWMRCRVCGKSALLAGKFAA